MTTVEPKQRVGLVHAFGAVSGEDLAAANEALYNHSDWQPGFDEIWLCDEITEFVVMPHEMQALVGMEIAERERIGAGRVALIMTRDVVRMIGELYQRLVAKAKREVNIMMSLDEAVEWLGMRTPPEWFSNPDLIEHSVVRGGRRDGW